LIHNAIECPFLNPNCCALWHSICQHPEATACSEQCSSGCFAGAKAMSHQATILPAAPAAISTLNHLKLVVLMYKVLDHIDASVLESSNQAM